MVFCSSGIQPLVDILETYGGWPVVKGDTWKSDDWNWLEIGQNISKEGLDSLIMETYVYTDLKNTSKRILSVSIEHFKHFSMKKNMEIVSNLILMKELNYASIISTFEV